MTVSAEMTVEDWFICRIDDPPVVRVMQRNDGGWDVMVRIDGGYRREDAERSALVLCEELDGLYRRVLLRLRRGWSGRG